MEAPHYPVCPDCGEAAGGQPFCGRCGKNLSQLPRLPTRDEWVASQQAAEQAEQARAARATEFHKQAGERRRQAEDKPKALRSFYRLERNLKITVVVSALAVILIIAFPSLGGLGEQEEDKAPIGEVRMAELVEAEYSPQLKKAAGYGAGTGRVCLWRGDHTYKCRMRHDLPGTFDRYVVKIDSRKCWVARRQTTDEERADEEAVAQDDPLIVPEYAEDDRRLRKAVARVEGCAP